MCYYLVRFKYSYQSLVIVWVLSFCKAEINIARKPNCHCDIAVDVYCY